MNELRHPDTSWPGARARRGIGGIAWSRLAAAALAAVAIGAVVLFLAVLANQPRVPAAALSKIVSEPGGYVGEQVVVSGQVQDLLTHRAFTLGSASSGGSLLVLVEASAVVNAAGEAGDAGLTGYVAQLHGPLYRAQASVKLVGTVERFDRAALADQLGMVLNAELFGRFEGQPVLLVEQLDTTGLLGLPSIVASSARGAASPNGTR